MYPSIEMNVRDGYSVSSRINEPSGIPDTPIITSELTLPELLRLFEMKRNRRRISHKDIRFSA
jgi:hypothetical protein